MKLIIVSNRLPVRLNQSASGRWEVTPSSGGLVTAMTPVLKQRGGMWIGWADAEGATPADLEEPLNDLAEQEGYDFASVQLSDEEHDGYYVGFSNEVLWPLLHDLQTRANFDADYWDAYLAVNNKFADVVHGHASDDDVIWVHDYHLICVAARLRELGVKGSLEFFLHTPFPPADIFAKLPWREKILRSLLQYDAVGFQTERDRENYLQCVHHLLPDAEIEGDGRLRAVRLDDHVSRVGYFPISIDANNFEEIARSEEVENERARLLRRFEGRYMTLGVDRLDYTKGIPQRLSAFAMALERYPELRGRATLLQLVVPSRDIIPEYASLKEEIEQMVGEINGTYTTPGWVPIHYMFRSLSHAQLIALYRASDTMLVTPLKDGMNLVAKEFCTTNLNEDGVLILSEFAGAAPQLERGALMVNPYDTDGMAEAILRAYEMPADERKRRMRIMRQNIAEEDIYWWVDSFLEAAERDTSTPA